MKQARKNGKGNVSIRFFDFRYLSVKIKAKHTRPHVIISLFSPIRSLRTTWLSEGSMKQWNKPFFCKRTRYSEYFRLEWRLALHKTMTWEVSEVFSPYKRLIIIIIIVISDNCADIATSTEFPFMIGTLQRLIYVLCFVFGLFLLGGGRQMKVEHRRKQCFML